MAQQPIDFKITATDSASGVFKGIESSLDRLKASYGQFATVLGGAGIAGFFVAAFEGAVNAGVELEKLSQKVGISVESLSGLKFAFGETGVGVDQLQTGLKKFAVSLVEASNPASKMSAVFKALGVDVNAGPLEAFRQFADAVKQLEDGELKTALATGVLGRSGIDLIVMLNKGAKGMDDAAERAKNLGIVMSGDTAKAMEEFDLNLKRLETGSTALGISLFNLVGGGLNAFVDKLVKAKEQGNLLLTAGKELVKLNWGFILPEKAADALFDESGQNGALNGPVTGRIRGVPQAPPPPVPNKDALRKALSGPVGAPPVDTELNLYTHALQRLKLELAGLESETTAQKIAFEEQTGTLQKLTAAHKENLLVVARQIDARKQFTAAMDIEFANMKQLEELHGQADDAVNSFYRSQRLAIDAAEFQNTLLGKNAADTERSIALNNLLLAKQQALASIKAEPDTQAYRDASAGIERMAAVLKGPLVAALDEARTRSQSWSLGMRQAINEYVDAANNNAELFKNAFGNSFKQVEDALVSFTTTGKANFKSMADSIIQEFARIQIRKQIAGAASLFSDFFFGTQAPAPVETRPFPGRAAGGDVYGGASYLVGERGPEVFTPRSSGWITPNGGGGNVTIQFMGGPPTDPQRFLSLVVPVIERISRGVSRQEISGQLRNGGVLA